MCFCDTSNDGQSKTRAAERPADKSPVGGGMGGMGGMDGMM